MSTYTRIPDPRRVQQRAAATPAASGIGPIIGLTTAERERASIANFVRAQVHDDKTERAFFAEVSEQVAKATGRPARGFQSYLVPGDVTGPHHRDMTKAVAASGGYLIGSEIVGFSAALDAATVTGRLPMTMLPNMTGDAIITRESVKGTAGWLADEGSAAPDAQSTFGQIAMTPKTISATVTATRQLLKQSGPAGEAFIERALAMTVAEAVDRALVAGTGASGQPTGLATLSGIDTRTGASFTWAMAQAMAKVASGWAASDSLAWIAGVDAAEDLKTRERAAGSGFIVEGDMIDGRPLLVSRSIGAQVLLVAPWAQVWMASWGALELATDPMTYFKDGRVILRCLWSIDFAVERAASIAIATAVT